MKHARFSRASGTLVVCSQPHLGGGELSLLEDLENRASDPSLHFLIPSRGKLSQAVSEKGWSYSFLSRNPVFDRISQRDSGKSFFSLALFVPAAMLFGMVGVVRLALRCRGRDRILSHGLRSHVQLLVLAPALRERLIFDIRDFIQPLWLRKMISAVARVCGCRIRVNSHAVGRDYSRAEVVYPRVKFTPSPATRGKGRLVMTHVAFFAPYKGQDLFLLTARKAIDAGIDADFWLVGDVIYPQKVYAQYRESVYRLAKNLNLEGRVRFWGAVDDRGSSPSVAELLAGTDLLLHCTREPEPFGRVIVEGIRAGCEVICHRDSGACETLRVHPDFVTPFHALRNFLPPEFVRVTSEEKRLSG